MYVASFKEISLKSDFIHFFHDLIYVYSPGAGAYSPGGTKFWCQQKPLVTPVICCLFQSIDDNSFWKIHCFTVFPYKSRRDQIKPCRKISQGHHLSKLGSTWAPDYAYQVSRSSAFWFQKRRFLRFLPYMGMAAILLMWPVPFEHTFVPPSHRSSIWNLILIGPVVSEEKMFEECGRRLTTEAYLTYKLTNEPSAQLS